MNITLKGVIVIGISVWSTMWLFGKNNEAKEQPREFTAFQTSQPWKPTTDCRADVAIVYGVGGNPGERRSGKTFEERVQSWRDHGYITHFMTGIAWGEYKDYFTGEWDGRWHLDEGQKTIDGDTIWHGTLIPYIVPTRHFLEYFKERHIKRVIDAGIESIYLEEPEFWARAGYSDAFKREWQEYYGFEWRPQHLSAANTYLSNKLKYHLYYRALNEAFAYAKEYGKSLGKDIRCYVPTHSLVNYSQWEIVSPEASLASLPVVDGYIAQVWTGTSRTPNYYDGRRRERVFETAFLEYGCMESMTAPTKRRVYFLTDPIEDRAVDWADYKRNYQATFVAKLLYPDNNYYEVMPWPDRIYEGLYRESATSDNRIRIPRFYSTQMQVMINSLNSMPVSPNRVSGSQGIAVLMANSLMFQRTPTPVEGYNDPQLSNFYGLTLPLLKRGVPVKIMHIENTRYAENWHDVKLLLMTYSNMKPLDAEAHKYIAQWVKQGGVLVYCGTDTDPFQSVPEWWNSGNNNYAAPGEHLFETMKMPRHAQEGVYSYGKGAVMVIRQDPKEFVMHDDGDAKLIDGVTYLYENKAKAGKPEFKNNFRLTRGCYELVAVLDEGVSDSPVELKGRFIDLFDPELPCKSHVTVKPGEQAFLYNVDSVESKHQAQVLAAAARVYDENRSDSSYRFVVKSPQSTTNAMRVLVPEKPRSVLVDGVEVPPLWDNLTSTLLIKHDNSPQGVKIEITW